METPFGAAVREVGLAAVRKVEVRVLERAAPEAVQARLSHISLRERGQKRASDGLCFDDHPGIYYCRGLLAAEKLPVSSLRKSFLRSLLFVGRGTCRNQCVSRY